MVEKREEAPESDMDTDHARVPSHPRTLVNVGWLVPKVHKSSAVIPISTEDSNIEDNIDTAAPFESVKAAVSKFGGIVDWKAHRKQTVERRKFIGLELEKARDEIPCCKRQSEAAEKAKNQVVKELDDAKRLIEELKLNLERAQRDEQQAKQDSELAMLRVEELEQGIAAGASFAARAQLEVAKARRVAAVSELKIVEDELEQVRSGHSLLVAEKDTSVKKAAEAVSRLEQVDRFVEVLTVQLIIAKALLESANAANLEDEERRNEAIVRKGLEILDLEKGLKLAEDKIELLNQKVLSSKDLKSKLDAATALLQDLKSKLLLERDESARRIQGDVEKSVTEAKSELEEVKISTEKASHDVKILKMAAASLELELNSEREKFESVASTAVESLEEEQDGAIEANRVDFLAEKARQELQKAKEEAEIAKAGASAVESRLIAARKKIDSAKAGENLALAVINALEASESAQRNDTHEDSATAVELTLEEYYELSKKAHDAEAQARIRVAAALSEIDAAKESESRSLDKLGEVERELLDRKALLENALKKADEAKQGKLDIEQELRNWRSEHEQRRKAMKSCKNLSAVLEDKKGSSQGKHSSDSCAIDAKTAPFPEARVAKKKKKSLFPRIYTFLTRKKGRTSKSS